MTVCCVFSCCTLSPMDITHKCSHFLLSSTRCSHIYSSDLWETRASTYRSTTSFLRRTLEKHSLAFPYVLLSMLCRSLTTACAHASIEERLISSPIGTGKYGNIESVINCWLDSWIRPFWTHWHETIECLISADSPVLYQYYIDIAKLIYYVC